jgi:Putative DNA-binding domain
MGDEQQPNLDRVQRWFQAVITHPDGVRPGAAAAPRLNGGPNAIDRVITRSSRLSAADRLNVYANAYYARLLECLGDVFPVLKRTLGDDAFGGFAFGYLQSYPSRSYTLNELGRSFPQYLQETRPPCEQRERDASGASGVTSGGADDAPMTSGGADWADFLIDLARLEWEVYEVFDCPGTEDGPALTAERVSAIDPHHWPTARLTPAPCLRLLETRYPVNAYYTAMRRAKDDQTVAFPDPVESYLAVNRLDYAVQRYDLTRAQHALLSAVLAGKPVGEAIARAADAFEGDATELAGQLQRWFHDWTAGGFFVAVEAEPDA